MLNPMRDNNEGMYRGGEEKTPVTTACPAGEIFHGLSWRLKLMIKKNEEKPKETARTPSQGEGKIFVTVMQVTLRTSRACK